MRTYKGPIIEQPHVLGRSDAADYTEPEHHKIVSPIEGSPLLLLGLNLSTKHFDQFNRWRLPAQSLPGSLIELPCNLH
jgi:hypothetical protein